MKEEENEGTSLKVVRGVPPSLIPLYEGSLRCMRILDRYKEAWFCTNARCASLVSRLDAFFFGLRLAMEGDEKISRRTIISYSYDKKMTVGFIRKAIRSKRGEITKERRERDLREIINYHARLNDACVLFIREIETRNDE